MISAKELSKIGSIATRSLTEATTFPVEGLRGVGLDIANNDTSTPLIFTISGNNKDGAFSNSYRVPAGTALNELFPPFTSINVTQTTTSFDILLKEVES